MNYIEWGGQNNILNAINTSGSLILSQTVLKKKMKS